ncbi:sugar ABC transporter substrate-binding protein [Leucobacter sp. Psy1]|uniref:ABC transporter substrate-binding protein n=1 Tax=Leucobacter sp. Psy1 TaxID=2875729 RepID=UPI001CD25393|nr:ABC transporter substrate-binding protein [Leucobacter sp. Psy1]UBH05618.1 sugar ABC transporter substrate-binding protein [Leucobacter sp. Psy1]
MSTGTVTTRRAARGFGRGRVGTAIGFTAATALMLSGCAGGGGGDESLGDFEGETLTVAAAWSGAEQENFEAVLQEFSDRTGAQVDYTSFGDNGPTYIQGQLEGGTPPNVAVIGQPALMQSLAQNGDIVAVGEGVQSAVAENYADTWADLGSVDGDLYGVWFKVANKSTVWYNSDIYDEAGAEAPEDWDGFLDQLQLVSDAGYSGISVGADVGWPLTDWFENVYLRTAGPEKYDQLTNHEIPWTDQSVKDALEVLASLWGTDLVQPGGDQRDFPTSVTEVFGADPEAGTVFEGDFVAGNIAADGTSVVGENALFYDFPAIDGSDPSVVSGGDVAVQFADDEATAALMEFLASPDAAEVWVPEGGLLSANSGVDTSLYPDETTQQIAESLLEAEEIRFDMSDLAPSAFGGTPGQGFWQEMISFYQDPSDIDGTAQRLEDAAADAY